MLAESLPGCNGQRHSDPADVLRGRHDTQSPSEMQRDVGLELLRYLDPVPSAGVLFIFLGDESTETAINKTSENRQKQIIP